MSPERSLAVALTALGLSSTPARAQDPPIEVTVRAEPPENSTAETLGAEQARRSAGTQDDPAKALETLPGVARGGPSAEGLVVWGSESSETRVYLDGVELPWLYHGSAIRSVIPQGVLSTLTLVPGAYGAEHGRGLGGLVTLQSRPVDREAARYLFHADLIDAGARVSAPLGPRASAVIAGRYGYLERWLPNLTDHDVERLYTIPSYYDGYARASLDLGGDRELALQALASHDRATRSIPSTDPETRVAEGLDRDFQRFSLHYRTSDAAALAFAGKDSEERSATTLDGGWSLSLTSTVYGLRAQKRATLSDLASSNSG